MNSFYVLLYVLKIFCVLVAQSCLTLCNTMDCSPPGSSVHGILQARILEWVAISFSKKSSRFTKIESCLGYLIPPSRKWSPLTFFNISQYQILCLTFNDGENNFRIIKNETKFFIYNSVWLTDHCHKERVVNCQQAPLARRWCNTPKTSVYICVKHLTLIKVRTAVPTWLLYNISVYNHPHDQCMLSQVISELQPCDQCMISQVNSAW